MSVVTAKHAIKWMCRCLLSRGAVAPVVGEVHIRAREARHVLGILFSREPTQPLLRHNV